VPNTSLLPIKCQPKHLSDYASIVPEVVDKIKQTAKPLKGVRIAHMNATSLGGGVAEMLRSVVPLQQDIGLDSRWYVIPPNEKFFKVTKEIHNFLQGKKGDLTKQQKQTYLEYSKFLAGLLAEIPADIFIVHDPQPAASLTFLNGQKPKLSIWRAAILIPPSLIKQSGTFYFPTFNLMTIWFLPCPSILTKLFPKIRSVSLPQ